MKTKQEMIAATVGALLLTLIVSIGLTFLLINGIQWIVADTIRMGLGR